MGVETAADSLMTRTPDLSRSGCLLERRVLLVSIGGSPCVQLHIALSLHEYRAPSKLRVRAESLRNAGIRPRSSRPEQVPCKSHNAAMWPASAGADALGEHMSGFRTRSGGHRSKTRSSCGRRCTAAKLCGCLIPSFERGHRGLWGLFHAVCRDVGSAPKRLSAGSRRNQWHWRET